MRHAKVFSKMFGYSVPDSLADGKMIITVEYKVLFGAKQGGKVTFTIDDVSSSEKIRADIDDLLSSYLSELLSIEIKPRDIVTYS